MPIVRKEDYLSDPSMNNLRPAIGSLNTKGCLLFFAIPWTLFSCIWTSAALFGAMTAIREKGSSLWVLAFPLFGLPFVAIGIGMLWHGLVPWIARSRIMKPDIAISSTEVRLGDRFSISYFQTFKNRADVRGVKLSLLFRETARYSSGSSSVTVHHDEPITEFEYPARTYEAGEQMVFSRSMEIPCDGMHTFHASNNHILWLLKIKVDVVHWPDYQEEFEIQVLPARAI
jgi:hypothetical protein